MGGTKSKFEQTDWIRAHGRLEGSENTIDGQLPTSHYGVYYVTKTKMNQREFEITDLEKNLLYTTKCVPGTLCWFDVYGRGLGEGLLRVQVDLTRRYWIVYRMGTPCFKGQLADRAATEKLANDRLASKDKIKSATAPFLFRKCCITVSWSRYMAVAMQYGAPPEGSVLYDDYDNDCTTVANEADNNDSVDDDSKLSQRMRSRTVSSEGEILEHASVRKNDNHDNDDAPRGEVGTESESISTGNEALHHQQGDQTLQSTQPQPAGKPKRRLSDWVKETSRSLIPDSKSKKKQGKHDPREGIINVDQPMLLCQEIYDKFIGNHQTSILSKKAAIELLKQDLEQHKKDGGTDSDDAFLTDQTEIFAQLNPEAQQQTVHPTISSELALDDNDNTNSNAQQLTTESNDNMLEANEPGESVPQQQDSDHPGMYNGEPNEANMNNDGCWDRELIDASSTISTKEDEPLSQQEQDDAIIGYWKWENTWKTQQIKMHVAAGSDLALHVVLAIIANQVRYERNAIACTI